MNRPVRAHVVTRAACTATTPALEDAVSRHDGLGDAGAGRSGMTLELACEWEDERGVLIPPPHVGTQCATRRMWAAG